MAPAILASEMVVDKVSKGFGLGLLHKQVLMRLLLYPGESQALGDDRPLGLRQDYTREPAGRL